MVKEEISQKLQNILKELGVLDVKIVLEHPGDSSHGDYSSNVALVSAKKLRRNPMELAEEIVKQFRIQNSESRILEKVEPVKPGFINFFLSQEFLLEQLDQGENKKALIPKNQKDDLTSQGLALQGKRVFIEFAHPNTHKEMHIGHMRTLITGEALARLFEATGATVFRANYQGDIGPHVAKALYGVEKLLDERNATLEDIEKMSKKLKAHFLGEAYVRGNQDYEEQKDKIDGINNDLYNKTGSYWDQYLLTRQWSLDYYDEFYKRFYTTFDQLFFESQMVDIGKEIVKSNVGNVFIEDEGAIIFPGEEYGLHRRVFITKAGNPTYEGKEMANGFAEYEAFPFDQKVHVVASEQAGYFQVVFKALELLDPEKFKDKQHHVSMGMVHLSDRKMSSRTGDIVTVDWLIDQVKHKVQEIVSSERIKEEERDDVAEEITIGAIKYSVLKGSTGSDVAFDIEKSLSLEGDSGPYIQYSYARTQSILAKAQKSDKGAKAPSSSELHIEERSLLRTLYRYPEVVDQAAREFSPNVVCSYLFDLAQKFNLFYQKHKIIGSSEEGFRLGLTASVGEILKNGLFLLGIKAPEKM